MTRPVDHPLQAGSPAASRGETGRGRQDFLASLFEIASALTSKEDLAGVLGIISRELSLLVPIDAAGIALLDERSQDLSLRVTFSKDKTRLPTEAVRVPLDQANPMGWVVLNRRPLWRNDIGADLRFPDFSPASLFPGAGSDLIAPLLIGDRVLGTLVLAAERTSAFTAADFEVLQRCGQLAAVAVENNQLYRQTQELSLVDPLTSVYNRRHFRTLLGIEVERSRRYSRSLALIMVDVDHFKRVNDNFGHPIGDRVLQGIAQILGAGLRRSDVLSRYGGEEFAVLLQETSMEAAVRVAEKLRQDIEEQGIFENGRSGEIRTTASFGVGSYPDPARNEEELVSRADEALYRAKRQGRNRVAF